MKNKTVNTVMNHDGPRFYSAPTTYQRLTEMWAFFIPRASTILPLFKTDQIAWQSFKWG